MALTLTIGGASKELQRGTLRVSQTANGRATASFSILSADASYRPDLDDEVILVEDGTRIFGGLVDRPTERGVLQGAHAGIVTSVSAVDFNAYTERRYVNGTLATGTLKSMLTTLVTDYLSVYSVTLDAGQVDGPTLPDLTYEYRKLTDVLNELATLTAEDGEPYVWRIDAFKVLRMYQPSDEAAPFDVVGTSLPIANVLGDIEVQTSRQHYANRVIVRVPAKTEFQRTETFTGDGTTTTFQLQYTVLKNYGVVHPAAGGGETITDANGPGQWTYDPVNNTMTRDIGAPANGEVYNFLFDGSYAGLGVAEDAGEIASVGPWEKVIQIESVPSDTTAQAIADAELAKSLPVTKTVKYRTLEAGILPGQSQTINVPRRNVNLTAVVSDVVIRDLGKFDLQREVTVVVDDAQTNLGRGFRDVYKRWDGDRSAAGIAVATGATPVSIGPGLPNTSVQFNRNASFGGDAAFTYDEAKNSLVMGDGSSVTAGLAESCGAFGQNCHVAD